MFLNVQLALQVMRSPLRLEMTDSTFTYQAGSDRDDPRPVFEYHYQRDSPPGYPRSHLHIHAAPRHYTGEKPFPRLHLPTRRITLEQIVGASSTNTASTPAAPTGATSSGATKPTSANTQRHTPWPYDPPFDPPAN